MRQRLKFRYLLVGLALVAFAAVIAQFLPPDREAPVIAQPLGLAAWIGIEWAMEPHTSAEIQQFAAELQSRRIRYGYFYVSYLKPDGTFNATFAHAADFTRTMREAAPEITLLAWIGVPIQGKNEAGETINRLENAATRQQIARFAAMTVRDLGFDGVHLNAEMAHDGDAAFLSTLSDIRRELPEGALLSTTTHALRLTRAVTFVPYPSAAHHWSTDYLRDVAALADQVALMAYDSGLPFPADYRRWMAYQVREATSALAGSSAQLIIGVPTSEEWTPSHQTQAETLNAALWGLQAGLAESTSPDRLNGIAVYPYWETSAGEWDQINQAALPDQHPDRDQQ
jgi:hypothetical protein